MASDIKLIYNNDTMEFDIQELYGDLVRENGLETAVFISLFTDRRVLKTETDDKNLRGWWGDMISEIPIGSKLWLLERSKTTQDTLIKAKRYAEDALKWMINDGVVAKITVTALRLGTPGNDVLGLAIEILKKDGSIESFKYNDLWSGQYGIQE